MATKEHSYQNHPVIYKVTILGQEVSTSIKSIEGIESSLDYPSINEYRINEAVFTLSDPENDFNPQKANNFYSRWGTMALSMIDPPISESGYRAPVKIEAGFTVNGMEHTDTIYEGQILNVSKNAKTGDVRIVCSDPSQKIRDEDITDFGIQKKMEVEPSGSNLHGNYPFYIGLTEPSLESVSGTSDSTTLSEKTVLRTEGHLEETNYQVLPTGIQTEGGPLETDPILTFKSPYRSRTVKSVIEKLLEKYSINNPEPDIKLPIATGSRKFFSNLGRPGYEVNFSDTTETNPGVWQWPGTVTDMISNESDNELYLLISPTGSTITLPETPNPKPRIIKWNLEDDERELVTEIKDSADGILEEAWRFVANSSFTTFYVLGTKPVYQNATRVRNSGITTRPGFEFGSYDSSEYNNTPNSKVLIYRRMWNGSSWTPSVYINTSVSNNLYPQLAMHYHLGFARTDSTSQNRFPNRQGNLPDSRRNLYLASNGDLYYPYANRSTFGVAKATSQNTASRVIYANRDDDGFNLAGFDFWIDESNNYVYLAYTNIDIQRDAQNEFTSGSSRFKIIRKDLS